MYMFQTEQKRFPPVNDTVLLLFLYLPMHMVDKLSLAGFNKYIDVLIIVNTVRNKRGRTHDICKSYIIQNMTNH